MTKEKADRLVELLFKLVKLQRLMVASEMGQRDVIYKKADEVIDEVVADYDGNRTWCEALLTFGGQYFGQSTAYWVNEVMSPDTVLDCLKREVYMRNDIKIDDGKQEEPHGSQSMYLVKGAAGKLPEQQQDAYNFYHKK